MKTSRMMGKIEPQQKRPGGQHGDPDNTQSGLLEEVRQAGKPLVLHLFHSAANAVIRLEGAIASAILSLV